MTDQKKRTYFKRDTGRDATAVHQPSPRNPLMTACGLYEIGKLTEVQHNPARPYELCMKCEEIVTKAEGASSAERREQRTRERVTFRLIRMPCCRHLFCWVNPRLPNFCPECGTRSGIDLREGILVTDDQAELSLREGIGPANLPGKPRQTP